MLFENILNFTKCCVFFFIGEGNRPAAFGVAKGDRRRACGGASGGHYCGPSGAGG